MFDVRHTQHHITACIDLFKGQFDAVDRFDTSMEGFWTSFRIVLLAALPFCLVVIAEFQWHVALTAPGETAPAAFGFYLSRFVSLPLDWVLFPILMIPVVRWLSFSKTYVPYVVVRNWSNLPTLAAYALVALLYLAGVLSETSFILISLVAFAIGLRLRWLALRFALKADVTSSILLLLADVTLSLFMASMLDGVFGV